MAYQAYLVVLLGGAISQASEQGGRKGGGAGFPVPG